MSIPAEVNRILPLTVSEFFAPQKKNSSDIPLQRVRMKLPVLLELLDLLMCPGAPALVDVLRKLSLHRDETLCLTFL